MTTYVLSLSKMRFFGRHGVYAEETRTGQPFEVTVRLTLPLPEREGRDQLGATVDYCEVQALTQGIVEGRPSALIETVADTLADALLERFPAVQEVEVEVFKPKPPVTFVFDGVSARIVRLRREWQRS